MSNHNPEGEAEIKKCPRCDSLDTKFCYYNNKKTTQPRYVCKNCKRLWTDGGKVRDIPSKGGEERMKRARDSAHSEGPSRDSPSTALSSPPLPPGPLTITSADGTIRRAGSLNLTRPQPAAHKPQLKFVRLDINSLSGMQGFNSVLNPWLASSHTQGQNHPVQPNHQAHQASYGPRFAAPLEPSNRLGIPWGNRSSPDTTRASLSTEPRNANLFYYNSNQIGPSGGGLSGSSSSA